MGKSGSDRRDERASLESEFRQLSAKALPNS
jgi:hypothetical protein